MPSPLYVPVTTISSITPHQNADTLDVAQVLGWQVVIKRGTFAEGNKVVYFPPDTCLTKEFSDAIGVTSYLSNQRIKATRLRGVPSFGLVIKPDMEWEIGYNLANYYGATKYEPPTRENNHHIPNPDRQPGNPLFPDYTHINNLRNYQNVFAEDEVVVITEKLHGTNSRIGMVDGKWLAGSHHVIRGEGDNLYWSPVYRSQRLVESLSKHHKQVILYGEILGSDVQSLDYGFKGHEGYAAFDLMIDGRYVDFYTFKELCLSYNVPMVPLVIIDTFDFNAIRHYASGETSFGPLIITVEKVKEPSAHMREGVVIKPLVERYDPKIGRTVLKYVSDDFLLGKQSDFMEV